MLNFEINFITYKNVNRIYVITEGRLLNIQHFSIVKLYCYQLPYIYIFETNFKYEKLYSN